MNELKDKNQAIRQQNKIAVRELEEFYVNGTINDITKAIDTLKEEKVNEYDLTLFIKESEDDKEERFLRFTETHFQRCYSLECVKQLLQEAGMELVAVYDAYTKNPLREDSEKVTIIARESGK